MARGQTMALDYMVIACNHEYIILLLPFFVAAESAQAIDVHFQWRRHVLSCSRSRDDEPIIASDEFGTEFLRGYPLIHVINR
jgi:hypothetical protein